MQDVSTVVSDNLGYCCTAWANSVATHTAALGIEATVSRWLSPHKLVSVVPPGLLLHLISRRGLPRRWTQWHAAG